MGTTEPHVVRDLGHKLAEDLLRISKDTMELVKDDEDACFRIATTTAAWPLTMLAGMLMLRGRTLSEAKVAICDLVDIVITEKLQDPEIRAELDQLIGARQRTRTRKGHR